MLGVHSPGSLAIRRKDYSAVRDQTRFVETQENNQ